MPLNIAILVSGRGSNLKAILEAIERHELNAKVQTVVSNQDSVPALDIARSFNVTTKAIPSVGLTRQAHEELLWDYLKTFPIDYVVMAGYMRILSKKFLQHYYDEHGFYRVVNIHPSLLPAFPGKSAYEDAFAAGVSESGITIHLVDEHVDRGQILAQESFPRLPQDSLLDFTKRGLVVEYRLYSSTLQQLATNHELQKLPTGVHK